MNAEVHNNLGNSLAETGRLDEAIEHYLITLKQNPEHADAHNNLGIALAMKGKLDEAIEQFQLALRYKPEVAGGHSNLGNALAAQHKLDEAIREYETTLRLNPKDARAHNNLGNALAEQGKITDAIEQYREALRLNADNPEAERNLGLAIVARGPARRGDCSPQGSVAAAAGLCAGPPATEKPRGVWRGMKKGSGAREGVTWLCDGLASDLWLRLFESALKVAPVQISNLAFGKSERQALRARTPGLKRERNWRKPVNMKIRILLTAAGILSLSAIETFADTTWISTSSTAFITAGNWNNGLPSANPQLAILKRTARPFSIRLTSRGRPPATAWASSSTHSRVGRVLCSAAAPTIRRDFKTGPAEPRTAS